MLRCGRGNFPSLASSALLAALAPGVAHKVASLSSSLPVGRSTRCAIGSRGAASRFAFATPPPRKA
eukprot:12873261-Alexandrium_andersonii.AAC.1